MGLNPLKFGGRIKAKFATSCAIVALRLNPLKFGGRIQAQVPHHIDGRSPS